MTMPTRPAAHRLTLAPVLALALLAGLAGCSRDNPTAKAVKSGGRDLHAVSGGGAASPPTESSDKLYKSIGSAVQPVADKGRPGDNSAANILLSRSQSGLSESALDQVFAAEREGMNRLTVLRAQLREYSDRGIIAQSAGSFDATARIAELAKSGAELTKQIEAAKAAKAVLDKKIAELRAQAQGKLNEAQPHQVAYADLHQQASTSTATQAEALIKQANERKRAGDKLRSEADWLDAQADQIVPQAAEAGVNISKLETLKAGLEGESASLAARGAAAKKEASEARAAATSAAEDLRKKLDELTTFRTGPLTKAGDDAIKAITAAIGSAKKAQQDASSQSRMNVGELQQSLGDLYFLRAVGTRQYAEFLGALGSNKPEFPDAAKFAESAKASKEAMSKNIADAKAAYEAAKAAYEGSGAKGEAKERMTKVGETLSKLGEFVDGKDADFGNLLSVPKAAEPAPVSAAPAPAAAPAGDAKSQVIAALAQMIADAKAGRFDKLADEMATGAGDNAKLGDAVRQQMVALGRLDAASRAKFGKGLLEGAPDNQMMAGVKGAVTPLAAIDMSKLDVKVEGDIATITGGGIPRPVKFRNQGGAWKQEADMSEVPAQMQGMMVTAAEMMGKFIDEAIAGIQSGSLQSPDAALNDVGMKLQMAMMQQLQKKQGGG